MSDPQPSGTQPAEPHASGPDLSRPSALLVVGGGPAGLEAARHFRDAGGTGPVRLLTMEQHRPYFRPPLSKDYLRGQTARAELALEQDAFYAEQRIDVLTGSEAVDLDPVGHAVTLADGRRLEYGHCVLATGSASQLAPIEGVEHPDVASLRSLEDSERLRARAARADSAVVIGSGFIGCEAAVSLARLGVRVDMVSSESLPQAGRLGEPVAHRLLGWLREEGVRVRGGTHVESVADGHRVRVAGGDTFGADLVLVATGASPRVELAERAGLELAGGRVATDQHMATSAPDVLAAGDLAAAYHPTAGRRLAVEHWGDALAMGEVAGTVAAGGSAAWTTCPGFFSVIGDRTLTYAAWGDGWDEIRFVDHGDGAFTAWYGRGGRTVGVCAHDREEDYERGRTLVEQGHPLPS